MIAFDSAVKMGGWAILDGIGRKKIQNPTQLNMSDQQRRYFRLYYWSLSS